MEMEKLIKHVFIEFAIIIGEKCNERARVRYVTTFGKFNNNVFSARALKVNNDQFKMLINATRFFDVGVLFLRSNIS